MKIIKIVFVIGALLFSCSNDNRKPDNLIDEQKMSEMLVRIHLAESKSSNSMLPSDSAIFYYKTLEDSIFTKYGVSKEQYIESYMYYMKNVEKMDKIYTRVIDSLSMREVTGKIEF